MGGTEHPAVAVHDHGLRDPWRMVERFHQTGRKVTPQRVAVVEIMCSSTIHPTADMVYAEAQQRLRAISQRTVYQVLTDLCDLGEIKCLNIGSGAARFDPNNERHQHLLCDRCGQLADVYLDLGLAALLDESFEGFRASHADVLLHGTCTDCTDWESQPGLAPG